jgi:hypothetical protein
MHFRVLTARWAALVFILSARTNDVTDLWHPSHAIPGTGTCVEADGAVGNPPAAKGIIMGW